MKRSPGTVEPGHVCVDLTDRAHKSVVTGAVVPALRISELSPPFHSGSGPSRSAENEDEAPHYRLPTVEAVEEEAAEAAFFEDGGVVLNALVSQRLDATAVAAQQVWSRHRRSSTLTPRAGNSSPSLPRNATRDSSAHSTPRARSNSARSTSTPRARSPSGTRRGSLVVPELSSISRSTGGGGAPGATMPMSTTGPRMAATVEPLNVAQSTVSRKSLSFDQGSASVSGSGTGGFRRASATTSDRLMDASVLTTAVAGASYGSPRESSATSLEPETPQWSTSAGPTTTEDAFTKSDSAAYLETLAASLTSAYVTVQTSHDISRIRESYDATDMPTRLCLRAMTIDPSVGAALRLYNEEASRVTELLFEDCSFSTTVDFAWLETLESLSVLRFKGRQTTSLTVERALARAPGLKNLTLFECAPVTNLQLLHSAHTPGSLSQLEIIGVDMSTEAFAELSRCTQIRELKLVETAVRADLRPLLEANVFHLVHLVRCSDVYCDSVVEPTPHTEPPLSSGEKPHPPRNPLKLHTLLIADCESLIVRHLPWSRFEALRELSVMYQRGTRVSAFHTILTLGRLTVLRLQQLFVDAHLVSLIRQCKGLEELNLSFCRDATDMNKLWPDLPKLRLLNLSFTDTETSDLRTLKACTRLREVYAWGCRFLREFHVFHEVQSLELLDLSQCASLEGRDLHGPFLSARTLTRLSLEGCTTLRDLHALKSLTALRSLNLAGSGVRGGEALAALAGFTRLRELNLSRCANVTSLPPLDELAQLVRVDLSSSQARDASLQAFCSCTALEEVDLSGCESITTVGPLGLCPSMYVLRLAGSAINDAGLEAFTVGPHPPYVLEELDLSGCTAIGNVSCLSALHVLQALTLAGSSVDSALSFPSLVSCDALEEISLCECYQVHDATHLAALKNIRDVNLSLTSVGDDTVMAFGLCSTLETLELSGCHNVTTVVALAGLPTLQRLNVSETQVTSESLEALRECPVLWEVNASSCAALANLSCFKGYRALQRLSAARSAVTDGASADATWQGSMLEELDLSQCLHLQMTSFSTMLRSLVALRKLDFTGAAVDTAALTSVAACSALNVLLLRECAAVDSLAPLGGLQHLRVVDASQTSVTDKGLDGLARCLSLTTLLLSGCRHIRNVHAGLSSCRALTELSLSDSAVSDASFSSAWETSGALRVLDLSGCEGIATPTAIWTLAGLETLDMSRTAAQDAAMAHLAKLAKLRTLKLCECRQLCDATALSALPQLKYLDLSGSSVKFIGAGGTIWQTPSLTAISLRGCVGLQNASALSDLPHLLTLDLSSSGVRDVTFASPWDNCVALEELNVSGCLNLHNISGVYDLPHLTRLLATDSAVDDSSVAGIGLCEKLELLDLSGCAGLTDVHHLHRLPRLQTLRLRGSAVTDVSFANTSWLCPSLHLVDLSGCGELTSVQGLRGLPRLQHLDVSHTSITDIGLYAVRECQSLQRLDLSGCVRTMNLVSLGKLYHLRFLDLRGSGIDITTLVSLSRCTQLEELDLRECPFLNNVFVPFEFGSLRVVRLPPLNRVLGAFLEACPDLEELTLRSCPANFQAQSFTTLHNLKRLDPSESELSPDFLSALRNCVALEALVLSHCPRLETITGLAGLRELRFLDLTGTPVHDDVCEVLLQCPGLQWLVVSECPHLQDISALSGLLRLRRLDASRSGLTDSSFGGIVAIRALEELDMRECASIRNGEALAKGMPRLRIADFADSGLTSLPTRALCRQSPMLRVLRVPEGLNTFQDHTESAEPRRRCTIEVVPPGTARTVQPSDDGYSAAWSQWVGEVLAKIAAEAY